MDTLSKFMQITTRSQWDLSGFIKAIGDSMKPVAVNFLYASDGDAAPALPPPAPQQPGASGGGRSLGPAWDKQQMAAHDEL